MKPIRSFISVAVVATLVFSLLPAQALANVLSDDSPVATTGQAECLSSDSVAITQSVFEADSISEFGIEVATDNTFSDAVMHVGSGSGSLFLISGLAEETEYYYRAYLYDDQNNICYGAGGNFTTPALPAAGTDRENMQSIFSDTAYLNSLLHSIGIDSPTFANLPQREAGFYEELAELVNMSDQDGALDFSSMPTSTTSPSSISSAPSISELPSSAGTDEVLGIEGFIGINELSEQLEAFSFDELVEEDNALNGAPEDLAPDTSQTSTDYTALREGSDLTAARLGYACYIADLNMGRDSDATDYEDEVVYMYLSHYVDMQPGDIGATVDYNSNAGKLSAWVTYYDREVYDSYLSTSGKWVQADNIREAASCYAGFIGGATNLYSVSNAVSKTVSVVERTIIVGAQLYDESKYLVGLSEASIRLNQSLNDENNSPQDVINDVRSVIAGHDYGKALEDYIISSAVTVGLAVAFGTLGVGTLVGLAVGTALSAINVTAMLTSDLTSYIYWLQMEQSLSGRLPGRILRFYGMW